MRLPRFAETLITIVPLVAAGLYLLGNCYETGYLRAFGIDSSLIPSTTDRTLFAGFLYLITISYPSMIYALGAFSLFVIFSIVVVNLSSTDRAQAMFGRIGIWLERYCQRLTPSSATEKVLAKSSLVHTYVAGFVFVLLLLMLMAYFSYKSGVELGRKKISDFQHGEGVAVKVMSPQLPGSYQGEIIACGDKFCAFWSNQGSVVLRHEVIESIVIDNDSIKGKAVKEKH